MYQIFSLFTQIRVRLITHPQNAYPQTAHPQTTQLHRRRRASR